jgi:hypothetical protein
MFNIKDGLLYYPASNQNYQGEVNFSVPNPDPEVTFKYVVKEGYTTLKQKRAAADRNAERAGQQITFPTREQLIAEAEEESPVLLFTITDSNGNIVRKVERPLRKGISSFTWDMSYLTNFGPAVPPGDYFIEMEKFANGKYVKMLDKKGFKVNTLNNNALGTPDYAAKFEFLKKAMDLNQNISLTSAYTRDVVTRIGAIKRELNSIPAVTHELNVKAISIEKALNEIIEVISGNRDAAVEADSPTISSRARFAISANSGAEANITGAQKEQYAVAMEKFDAEYNKLKGVVENDFPTFKQMLKEVGIQFTPGDLPENK